MKYVCCSISQNSLPVNRAESARLSAEIELTLINFLNGYKPSLEFNSSANCVDVYIDQSAWPYPLHHGDYLLSIDGRLVLKLKSPPIRPTQQATPIRSNKLLLL